MLLIEFAPPFRWRPKIERAGPLRGLLWGWLRVGRVPFGLNKFVEGIADAAVAEHKSKSEEK